MFWLWYLLIGLIAGWIANVIVRGSGSGLVINMIVGILGGFLGAWLVGVWGWVPTGTFGTLLASVVGAIILLIISSAITPRKGTER
ncbi:MAG: GlsB/YeaQ/YmgE family stress response membrane protein [Alistipes sp.]|nr:GlsB/YeaQ/YmgE family stress response membrane protein [Alistipes sp.]